MSEFYRRLRKAELHLHLEGSVEPETVRELDPSISRDEVLERYSFADFPGFIQSYIWITGLLKNPHDFSLIIRRLLERLQEDNVVYAEINLSVGVMLWRNQDVHAICDAIKEAASSSHVETYWIYDAVRHFGPEHVRAVAELAVSRQDTGVVAFGIGGDEVRGPANQFADTFSYVRDNGLAVVPHAGETAGADSVWAAVDNGARRIGHGIRSAEDPKLIDCLRDRDIPLEISITSNIRTGAVNSLESHPLRKLFDAGVPIVLNTDDPAMFGTTLSREFQIAAEHFDFSNEDLTGIAENAFRYRLGGLI